MASADIVVFGSINLDLVFATADLPLPGQTRLAKALTLQPGGKGANQAVAARQAGATVHMVGAVGQDGLAPLALAMLEETGVGLGALRRWPDVATGCASIGTDAQGRNQIMVALGANALLTNDDLPQALLRPGNLLLVQMEAEPAQVAAVMQRAQAAGLQVILNLAPAHPLPEPTLRCAGIIVVNEDEAAVLSQQLGCAPTAAALHARLGVTIIRTLGAQGAEAASTAGLIQVTAPRVQAVDTTAAGDCFVGTLAAALAGGAPLAAALPRACAAAALACTVPGSQRSLPSRAQVDAFIAGRPA